MNVSINTLTSSPQKWIVNKSTVEPDPLRRWAEAPKKSSETVDGFEKPEFRPVFAQSLREAHYASMAEQIKKFQKITVPPRPIAAVSGYGGTVPFLGSSNIIGVSHARAKEIAAALRAHAN